MKKLLWMAAFAFAFNYAMAQFTIKGNVRNSTTHEPLSGAHVSLENTFFGTFTNSDGNFTLHSISNDSYVLEVSFLGYESLRKEIKVSQNLDIQFELESRVFLTEEVEIQSTRAGDKVPVTFENISFQKIQSENLGMDLPMLLSNSISTVSSSDAGNGMGYTALRIRGTDITRINVTINGIPLNDPESHNVYWVDLPDFAASTDNIQIQRGVGTSTNGAAAFGASINLQSTRINQEPYAELSGSLGSFMTMKNTLNFGTGLFHKHWSFDGRISRLKSDGYIDRAASDLHSYFMSGTYNDDKTILRFILFSGTEKTYQAWDGVPSELLGSNRTYNGTGAYTNKQGLQQYYKNETDNYGQTHFQALFSRKLSSTFYLNAGAHYTKGAGYYEQYRENDDLNYYGIDVISLARPYYLLSGDTIPEPDSLISSSDIIRRKWLDNDFAGITYSLSWNEKKISASLGGSMNTYTGRHFGKVIWSEFAGNSELDHEWYRSMAIKNDLNFYAKANYELIQGINVFADLQVRNINYKIEGIDDDSRNINQKHTFTFFNPKAGAFFTVNSSNSAYISFAMANREPNRDNFVDADPIKPLPVQETLYDMEMGHSYAKRRLSISSNLFLMYYKDQLALTGAINDVGAPVMENVPESYRMGLEVRSEFQVVKSLLWSFHATFSKNKIKSYVEYIDDWDSFTQIPVNHSNTDLSFSPSITTGNEFRWSFNKNGNISLITRYVGKQYIDNTQDENRILPSYLVNDFRFSFSFHPAFVKAIECSLHINNFLNEKYESNAWVYRYYADSSFQKMDGYFPQAGINFIAGLSLKF